MNQELGLWRSNCKLTRNLDSLCNQKGLSILIPSVRFMDFTHDTYVQWFLFCWLVQFFRVIKIFAPYNKCIMQSMSKSLWYYQRCVMLILPSVIWLYTFINYENNSKSTKSSRWILLAKEGSSDISGSTRLRSFVWW